jgi:hypothetical protein
MAANVLNSPRAIEMSVYVVRAFVRLREVLATHKDLARKLEERERKYDAQFHVVFDAIRQLLTPPPKAKKAPIGFHASLTSDESSKGRWASLLTTAKPSISRT